MGHEKSEDSDHLYTPLESDDDEVNKFPTYKSDVGVQFHLGVMITNDEMIIGVIKDFLMENQKCVH